MRAPEAVDHSFRRGLAAIALGAFGLRVGAALFVDRRMAVTGDAGWYVGVARLLARGAGFVEPVHFEVLHVRIETASHPPLYPLFLSVSDFVGMHSFLPHRIWSCVPGTITVILVGMIGREIAGRRAGLIAAGVAAVSIALVLQDVNLWSEGFFGMTIAWTVLRAYRYLRDPRTVNALVLAVAITAAAMTRAEAVLLLVVLLVPLVLRLGTSAGERVRVLGACALVVAVLLAPWTIYNAGRFKHPVVLTTTFGTLLWSSNCDVTYYGPLTGGWGFLCAKHVPEPWPTDESVADPLFRRIGWRYIRDHADRLPVVLPLRVLRTFGFWHPDDLAKSDLALTPIGLDRFAWVAVGQYWVILALGVAGAVRLRRRRVALLPLLAPVVSVVVISIIGYGTMRFRVALDVVLPVGVGVLLGGRGSEREADRGPDFGTVAESRGSETGPPSGGSQASGIVPA